MRYECSDFVSTTVRGNKENGMPSLAAPGIGAASVVSVRFSQDVNPRRSGVGSHTQSQRPSEGSLKVFDDTLKS